MILQNKSRWGWARFALPILPLCAFALPVIDPASRGFEEQSTRSPHVKLDIGQLGDCIVEQGGQLVLDLARAPRLLDGTPLDASQVVGTVCAGPWPFEAEESGFGYRRFRLDSRVEGGKAVLPLKGLLNTNLNSEGWTDGGSVMLRLDLRLALPGADRELLAADLPLRFRVEGDTLRRLPALVEGPALCRVDSRVPGEVTITLKTDLDARVEIELEGRGTRPADGSGLARETVLRGLPVDTDLRYRVLLDGEPATEWLALRLPSPGAPVRFAFLGDSREQLGGGAEGQQGVSLAALERLLGQAWVHDADFLVMGGDLISGYTIWPDDFRAQLQAWKSAASGFWRERPVFCGIGNHETLLRIFKNDKVDWLGMDRWPYATESAEAVFAAAVCNPENGPTPSDPDLPPWRETVFSTRMGNVALIVLNNTWWYTEHADKMGGCPQGYLMEDQLRWLEREVRAASADPACQHIVYVMHEPVFPTGGHVKDSMWHKGDNRVRPFKADAQGRLEAIGPGILESRDRFLKIIAASGKSAVVLTGHEHVYNRLLITPETPVGDWRVDDTDGDGRICGPGEPCSPLAGLARPLWFVTNGGASPWYAEEPTPWASWWKARPDVEKGWRHSSQEAIVVFESDGAKLGLSAYNRFGELLDRVEDLRMAR